LLLFASEDTRAGIEAVLSTPAMSAAIRGTAGYVLDAGRAFAVAGTERGHDTQLTFVPMLSESDPDELLIVVHARADDVAVVHSAVVRRTPPETPGRFQRHGSLWVLPVDDVIEPDVARWSNEQKSDFWTCVIDRSTTTLVSCAIGCIFTAGGWVPCVVTCGTVGELTTLVGCAARVLVNTLRGRYDPKESQP